MAAEIAEPCIKYEDEFEASGMTQVKLETTGGAPVRSRKAPVFSAKFGVEGLFHVIDKYTAVSTQLNYTTAEKFTYFEEVLDTQAAKKWNTIIRPIVGNQRNQINRFNRAQDDLVHKYTGSRNPRNIMIGYIKSEACIKKKKVCNQKHADRIENLCEMTNRLRGTNPELDLPQIKERVFMSFPYEFRQDYYKNKGADLPYDDANFKIEDIVSQMNVYKGIKDKDEKDRGKKRKADSPERIRGGNGKGKGKGRRKHSKHDRKSGIKARDSDPCPLHRHEHKWGDCELNPKSSNYRGNRSTNEGRGRGYGGRGDPRGRGFGGPGRGFGGGRGAGRGRFGGRYH